MKKVDKEGISVVIPTFNRSKYLYATLLCLCNQKIDEHVKYEIIVVDSGDDETDKLVQSFQQNFNVQIIYKKIKKCRNRSLVRNKGADLSNFDILCFLDNDMLTPPDFIQTHFIKHQEKENLVLLGCRKSLINFDINQIGEEALQNHFEILEELPYYTDERLKLFNQNAPWRFVFSHTMSVRKDDFYKAGKFNVDFGEHWGFEDLELGFNLHLLGCKIELLTNQFTFHQPHFSQSNKEQHEESHNGELFLRLHNCFEVELCEYFYTSFDEYYLILSNLKSKFVTPTNAEQKEYDLILGCIFNTSEKKSCDNMQLGAYCVKEDNSCKKVLISNIFFELPKVLQMSIISEAFRVSKNVFIENIDITKIKKFQNIAIKAGLELNYKTENNIVLFTKNKEINSDLFMMILPDIFSPEKRYVYLWFASYLLKKGNLLNIRDIKKVEKICNEDFSLQKEDQQIIEQYIDRCFGKTKLQFINSLSMLLIDSNLGISNSKNTYIFHDEDYRLLVESLKYRNFNNANHFDETVFDVISFLSILSVSKAVMKKNERNYSEGAKFCCFMENGFFEDGIDIILKAFFAFIKENKNAKLTIKIPCYIKFIDKVFPLHNELSKENKLFANYQKTYFDLMHMQKYINDLDLVKNVEFMQENFSIEEIVEFINKNDVLIFASRGVSVPPQVYISLILKKRTIIGKHHMILNVLHPFCSVIESTPNKFATELKVPTSCMNIVHLTHSMNVDKLRNAFLEEKEKISDNTISLIESEAYSIIDTFFVKDNPSLKD